MRAVDNESIRSLLVAYYKMSVGAAAVRLKLEVISPRREWKSSLTSSR